MTNSNWPRILLLAYALPGLGCGAKTSDPTPTTTPTTKPTKTIPLGAVLDSAGMAGGSSWDLAADLAVTDMNAALAKANSEIRFSLIHQDATALSSVAVAKAQDLVHTQGVKGLIVDRSGSDLDILALQYDPDTSKALNVPLLGVAVTSPLANNPSACKATPPPGTPPCSWGADDAGTDPRTLALRDAEHWNFRTTANTSQQGLVTAKVAAAKGGANHKVSILVTADAYGSGILAVTTPALTAQGFTQIEVITLNSDSTNPNAIPSTADAVFASAVALATDSQDCPPAVAPATTCDKNGCTCAGISGTPPDVVLLLATARYLSAAAKVYVHSGTKIPLVNGGGMRVTPVLTALGADGNGLEGVGVIAAAHDASGDVFRSEYKTAYGTELDSFDSGAYDAAALLMLASLTAAHGQADPTAITGKQVHSLLASVTTAPDGQLVRTGAAELQKAIALIDQGKPIKYAGASGPLTFDANNNVVDQVVDFQIAGTAFEDIAVYDCLSDPTCPKL